MVEIKRLKGTRDYDPEKAEILFEIIEKGRRVFPRYGFLPLDTSSLERWETLISKDVNAGEEIKHQTYNFKDVGGKHIGLRFDLTVSLIRYVVEHKNISLPFKRYQIGKVYRYEEAKRSRYREFYQYDLDIVGGKSFLYDAELLKVANDFFKEININNYTIYINNRNFTYEFLEKVLGIKKRYLIAVLRLIDKIDKITYEEFVDELKKYTNNIPINSLDDLYVSLNKKFYNIKDYFNAFGIEHEEIEELERALKQMNVNNYAFSMKIVRGLGYYTSNVFETFIDDEPLLGSIGGGGRYDSVFANLLNQNIPTVGYSFGVDRILDFLFNINQDRHSLIDVYISYVSKDVIDKAIEIRNILIQEGIKTYLTYDHKSLTNQIKHADKLGIEHLIIVGKKDIHKGEVTYKNLSTGEERKIFINELKVLRDVVRRH